MNDGTGTENGLDDGQRSDGGHGAASLIRAADFPIVGVGASAGGLEAFRLLLNELPALTGMAFVLVQHLDPTHSSFLAEALGKATQMVVQQPTDGQRAEPNHVYVIPPNADLSLSKGLFSLAPRATENRRPHLPIDSFFSSLARERGGHAIGVVLSGTASDGTEGLRAIKAENGFTFVQAPGSAKFGEMPRSAISAGVADYVLSIPELARELVRLSRHPYVIAKNDVLIGRDESAVAQILMVVRNAIGVDFAEYKDQTVGRRLARRMVLRRVDDAQAYLAILQGDPDEARALSEDILIHVTSFFRDREVFATLESRILPAILKNKPEGAPIRVWVAGCSTGEEVYSIGILLLELLGDSRRVVQIFGSDLSDATIGKARTGFYPDAALRDVNEERRRKYFVKTERGYKISKAVRDFCVFVQHDLARDPPFSKLDLVSCRNVLIYFGDALQKRVIPTFHYSLNQTGYLLLGHTESISGFSQLFSVVDKANKIFGRTAGASALRFAPRAEARVTESYVAPHERGPSSVLRATELGKHLDRVLLARYAPPGVLINERMEILQFRGQTGSFLQAAPGEPQTDLIKMARHGLLAALRGAIAEAKKEKAPVLRNGVEVDQGGFTRVCNLVVFPFVGLPDVKEQLYVVLFEDVRTPHAESGDAPPLGGRQRSLPVDEERRLPQVEHELAATKEYLQSLIEEHGRTSDDLGSANEELVSGNEELQSMNEELETAKEELQSTNEELTTVNDELHTRNQEVTLINSDLLNLLATVDIPIVILDLERKIRRFTPKARSILNVLPSDQGRPIDDIKPNIEVVDLDQQIAEVIETFTPKESEVQDREGRWHRMQIRPYKTADNKIDGAILSLVDIDALKHLVGSAETARAEAERANNAKDLFLAILGHELRTPLASLLLQAQMLRRGTVTDPTKLVRMGEAIERGTRMQVQLVDDLLDVSRIVAGKLTVELNPLDLGDVIRTAADGVLDAAARKSIKLDLVLDDLVGRVPGDATRLLQVITNLLTNAIKFTPNGGRVTVSLTGTEEWACLEVSDTGKGIEPRFLPRVFNRFSQEDSTNTRLHGGLGLGLAIVRHLVDQHGGTVRADSLGVGKGATFTVTLPVLSLPGDPAEESAISASASHRRMIARDYHKLEGLVVLVVDDDLATRETVAEMLKEMGAKVRVAESAATALTAVTEFKPNVLLCDIAMPGEDGYTFIRKVRALGANGGGGVPALALTALAAERDHREALAAGFQMFLTKPVDFDRLSEAVIELAARRAPTSPSERAPAT